MKAKTLIALTAASALFGGVTFASAQNGSTSAQDASSRVKQDTSSGVKSHAARANAHKKRSTTGMSVPEPGTTQRDKDVNTWATEK